MKPCLLFFCTILTLSSFAQDPIVVANQCYTDKNYDCAVEQYKKVLSEKKYKPESHGTLLYRIGFSLGQLKRNEEAIRFLKDALAANASSGETYWTLGWIYRTNMENHSLAVENYSKAIGLLAEHKDLRTLYYSRGDSYYILKKDSLALNDFLACLKIDSTDGNSYVGAGNAAYALKKFKDAEKWYERSVLYGDTSKIAMAARHYLWGQAIYKQNKYEESIPKYKKSLEISPSYKSSQWGIGAAYYNQNKWQDAIREYTKAMPFYTGDTASMKQLHYLLGKCYNELKDFPKAMASYDAAIKINPDYGDAVWGKASIYYQQKKWKEGAEGYSKAIQLNKDKATSLDKLHFYRGICYIRQKDTTKAKADFEKSLSYNYSDPGTNTQMGNINYAEKKYYTARLNYSYGIIDHSADSAELARIHFRKGFSNMNAGSDYFYTGKEAYLQSIKYDSTNKEAHRYMADAYYSQKSFALAESELNKCIRFYKNEKDSLPNMYIYRALAKWQQKNFKGALEDYEQSDKLKKFKEADYVKTMGQLAFEVKDYTKAIANFTRLIPMYKTEQKSELMFAYFGRGRSSFELQKKEPAITDLTKALELAPGNTDIKTWLDKARALQL